MSYARDLVYSFVNRMAKFAMQNPNGLDYRNYQAIIDECYEDYELRALLNQVEDDRAHAEAERLRLRAKAVKLGMGPTVEGIYEVVRGLAELVDPYEERDGQLVRKSDGKPVIL